MPELPEVESFRNYVADTSLGQTISSTRLSTAQMLWNTSAQEINEALRNNVFTSTFRHGKFLFIKLKQRGHLMLHFGMTGDLLYYKPDVLHPKAYVLLIRFSNGNALLFSDSRMLGKIALVDDIETFIKERGYGPDALTISKKEFINLLRKRRIAIKTALMNQKIIAGVGNEFSDAILFQCKVHPLSPANHLTEGQLAIIHHAMLKILQEAVHVNADRKKLDHYFLLNKRKAGLPCVRCRGKTAFKTIGGRSSYFCPDCQQLY